MQVLGHRGWPAPAHPENTLAGMTAALDAGADGVEVDVRLTADGVAVCCHDDDLTRVGGAVRSVARTTWAELSTVRLRGEHPVPRLVDVARAVRDRGVLVLDLKPEPRTGAMARAALGALSLAGTDPRQVVASSFDQRLLDVLAARRPALARAAILDVEEPLDPALQRAAARGDAAVHLPLSTLLREHRRVRESATPLRAWTVNRLVDARLAELLGVVGVITDLPATLASTLRPVAVAA